MVLGVDEHQCTNCGAALARTATYCLACDTAVKDTERGLSVGSTSVVKTGNPVVAVAVIGGGIVLVVLLVLGATKMLHRHMDGDLSKAATGAYTSLARAEGGKDAACLVVANEIVGKHDAVVTQCQALVGDATGTRLRQLHATKVVRNGTRGTVHLAGRVVDGDTRTPLDVTVEVTEIDNTWRLDWDGRSILGK